MGAQPFHTMMASASHDEAHRQDFVLALKTHVSGNITPGNKADMNAVAIPDYRRREGHEPALVTLDQLRPAVLVALPYLLEQIRVGLGEFSHLKSS